MLQRSRGAEMTKRRTPNQGGSYYCPSQQKPARQPTSLAKRQWTEEPTRLEANRAAPDESRDPRTGRFKPGHCPNPKGRPRTVRTVGATIAGALKAPIPVTENGRLRNISKLQAAAQQIANKSAAGDLRASKMAIDLAQRAEQQAAAQSPVDRLSASDEEIVERLKVRFRRIIKEEEEMEKNDGHSDTTGV
jgi:hypothetical protein